MFTRLVELFDAERNPVVVINAIAPSVLIVLGLMAEVATALDGMEATALGVALAVLRVVETWAARRKVTPVADPRLPEGAAVTYYELP